MTKRTINYYSTSSSQCHSSSLFCRSWSSSCCSNRTIDRSRILGAGVNISRRYRAPKRRISTRTISSIDRIQIDCSSNERLRPTSIRSMPMDLLSPSVIHLQRHRRSPCLRYCRRCLRLFSPHQPFSHCPCDAYTKVTFSTSTLFSPFDQYFWYLSIFLFFCIKARTFSFKQWKGDVRWFIFLDRWWKRTIKETVSVQNAKSNRCKNQWNLGKTKRTHTDK